jgi:Cdc6-like AAA superfamily ATPase
MEKASIDISSSTDESVSVSYDEDVNEFISASPSMEDMDYDDNQSYSSSATFSTVNDGKNDELNTRSVQGIKDCGRLIERLSGDAVTQTKDMAGFYILSRAIAGIARNKNLDLPFNIGIIGQYGSGKSKIVEQVKAALADEIEGSVPVKVVHFDVGRYHSSKEIWSALIYSFFDAFKNDKKFGGKWGIKARWKYFRTLNLWEIIRSLATVAGVFAATGLMISWKFIPIFDKFQFLAAYFPQIIFLLSLFFLGKNILKLWMHPAVAGSIGNIATMPLQLAKDFENRITFESKLKRLFKAWLDNATGERVVLIIENLDRCSSLQVTQIVDELYALIGTREIEEKLVCIVAVDENALKKAIKDNHGVDTDEYFEKLFSLKLYVPKLNGPRLEQFLKEVIDYTSNQYVYNSPMNVELNYDNYQLKDDEKLFIYQMLGGAHNRDGVTPRKAKRFISSYQFLKYIWPNWFADRDDFIPSSLASAVMHRIIGKGKELNGLYSDAADLIGRKNLQEGKQTNKKQSNW